MNKTLSRLFVIITVISILFSCMIFPASASSNDGYNGNLINYFHYYNGDLNFHLTQDNNTISFDLPTTTDFRYLDFTFFCWAGFGLSDVIVNVGGTSQSLNRVNLSSGIIRAYGYTNAAKSLQDHFTLTFVFSASTCDISFFSMRYSSITFESFVETARMGIIGTDHPSPITVGNTSTPINFIVNSDYTGFTGSVYLDNWIKYDYMDVLLRVNSVGLTSLYIDCDGIKVPFDYTFFDSSFGVINHVSSDYGSEEWHYTFLGNETNVEYLYIRVDLTNLVRDSSIPIIHFNGNWGTGLNKTGLIQFISILGFFQADTISPLGYFFRDLKSFLVDLFTADNDTQQSIDNSLSDNESIDQEISDGISDIGVHPGDLDLDNNLDQIGADPSHFIAFFSIIFDNYFVMRIFWIAALIMILGYIFHGQR